MAVWCHPERDLHHAPLGHRDQVGWLQPMMNAREHCCEDKIRISFCTRYAVFNTAVVLSGSRDPKCDLSDDRTPSFFQRGLMHPL